MNLIERIEARLSDPTVRINAEDFERCATDLLSKSFPNLIPITGGTDYGRDADLVNGTGEPPTYMAVTSSRSYEGARKNLRSAISSLTAHSMQGDKIIAVNLAALNQVKRKRLETLAEKHGFKLLTTVDRSYFSSRLREVGEWREKLLKLPGGPFSLSRQSGFDRLEHTSTTIVGREYLIETVCALKSDAVLWGHPGVGKSFALEQVNGLFFVEDQPDSQRLLDDILSTKPSFLAIDDVSRRMILLERLLHIRKQEDLTFRIVAVCWPHQRESITHELPGSIDVEVELLTRSEISAIVKDQGVTHHETISRVLDQARGRAGWAVRLIELLRSDAEWRSVYSGDALRGEITYYMQRTGFPRASRQLLAIVGLLGSVSTTELSSIAKMMSYSRLELSERINEIAIGGLLDAREIRTESGPEVSFSVAPPVLATSLVTAVYFSGEIPAVSVRELFDKQPSKRLSIATTTIRAVLLGSENAAPLAKSLFRKVVDDKEIPGSRVELLHHYLHLGLPEATEILRRLTLQWRELTESPDSSPEKIEHSALELIPYFVEAIKDVQLDSGVEVALHVALALEQQDIEPARFLRELIDKLRGFGPGGTVNTDLVTRVWQTANSYFLSQDAAKSDSRIYLLRECLRPTFDKTWQSIENPRVIEMAAGVIPEPQMSVIEKEIWNSFECTAAELSRKQVAAVVAIIGDWIHVAGDYLLSFGGRATQSQVQYAKTMVRKIADWCFVRCSEFPGLRTAIRGHAVKIGLNYPEPDPVIAVLFDIREPSEDWRTWHDDYEAQITEIVEPQAQDPNSFCQFLAFLKSEHSDASSWSFVSPVRSAFSVIATLRENRVEWLMAADRFGLLLEASALLRQILREGTCGLNLAKMLLERKETRAIMIESALGTNEVTPEFFEVVYSMLNTTDSAIIQQSLYAGQLPEASINALLDHPLGSIRASVAAALLTSSVDTSVITRQYGKRWTRAVLSVESLSNFDSIFGRGDFFEKLLVYPEVYEELLLRCVCIPEENLDLMELLECFESTAFKLPPLSKTRIWEQAPESYWRSTIFRLLAGNDMEWIQDLLSSKKVTAELVLRSANGLGISPSVESLARILVPLGCNPTEIASRIQYGTGWGEEHERIAGYLDEMNRLVSSDESSLQAVGEAGISYFTPKFRQALSEARRKAVLGEL